MAETPKRRIDPGMIVAFAALVVSICAVVLSFNEVRLVRSQTEASVWPHLRTGVNVNYTSDGDTYVLRVTNSGVGPARIRSFRVLLDGEPVHTWTEVKEALTGDPEVSVYNTVNGHVLPAGEEIRAFAEFDAETIRTLSSEWNRVAFVYCYCSVLDNCWVVDGREGRGGQEDEHREVDECVVDPAAEFRN
ncbi:MAG: hypothetical protein R3195_18095 [Gemmatimonadota bacterium]|nr:hypothetical protein [Gemmatimonadota bacterium]